MSLMHRFILGDPDTSDRTPARELPSALALWICLFLLIFAVVVGRAAGAALFLNHYGGKGLGLVYVLVGLAVVSIIYGISWATHGVRPERIAIGTMVLLGSGTLLFRLLLLVKVPGGNDLVYGALYVFLETFALVTTMQVWTLANRVFSSAQAKRLYVFIATGGIMGSLVGGAVIRSLHSWPTIDLLWLVAGACPPMVAATLVFRYFAAKAAVESGSRARPERALAPGSRSGTVRWIHHPVLRHRSLLRLVSKLGLVTFLMAFTTNLIDFYFKTYADNHFHGDTAQLTRFFGNFYLLTGCTSLAVQLLITPIVMRYSGVFGGLALIPAALSFGTAFNLVGASLIRATLLKLFDSGLAHSLYRSCIEMLYIPLPHHLTGEVKLISEGIAGRAGLVTAGLVLFGFAPVLTPRRTLLLIAVLLALSLAALLVLERAYRGPAIEISLPDDSEPVKQAA